MTSVGLRRRVATGAILAIVSLTATTACAHTRADSPAAESTVAAATPRTFRSEASPSGAVPSTATAVPPTDSAGPPIRLLLPAAGLDAPIRADATPPGGVVDPVSYTDVAWLTAYGAPGSNATDTVYLAGHSSGEDVTVFDPLLTPGGTARDLAGEDVVVETDRSMIRYRIDGPARYLHKEEIATDPEVWRRVPGRLLLITCDQSRDDRNVVFFASYVADDTGPAQSGSTLHR